MSSTDPRMPYGSRSRQRDALRAEDPAAPGQEHDRQGRARAASRPARARRRRSWRAGSRSADVQREPADPQQPVERVAHAQRLELPRLLDQPLHPAREAQDRDEQEQEPEHAEARARAGGRREDVPDRLGPAARQLVAGDDPVGGAPAAELGGDGAGDDHQRDRGRQRAGGERDRAIEPATRWNRLTTRSTKSGRSQNVSVRATRSPRTAEPTGLFDRLLRRGAATVGLALALELLRASPRGCRARSRRRGSARAAPPGGPGAG